MEPTQSNELSASTAGFTLAAIIAIIGNTMLTVIKEEYHPLNVYMKSLTGHHWITHGVAVVAVFLLLGFVLSRIGGVQRMRASTLTNLLIATVIIFGLGIFGYFVQAYLA